MVPQPPHLDVYYASTCAPCRLELPAIAAAVAKGGDIRIVIVSDMPRARAELSAVSPPLAQGARLAEGATPRDRLRRAGDGDGILPFTRAVDGGDATCASWRGLLTRDRIVRLLAACRAR
ncbi:MAG TPA: hypothetical protein VGC16_00560 [Rhizomicrobium sp.]